MFHICYCSAVVVIIDHWRSMHFLLLVSFPRFQLLGKQGREKAWLSAVAFSPAVFFGCSEVIFPDCKVRSYNLRVPDFTLSIQVQKIQ